MGESWYIIANGLIYKVEMLDCPEADKLARINKHQYAEGLIREHGNSVFHTNSIGFIRRTRTRKIEDESINKELLAALKLCLDDIQQIPGREPYETIIKAIAKAEGES